MDKRSLQKDLTSHQISEILNSDSEDGMEWESDDSFDDPTFEPDASLPVSRESSEAEESDSDVEASNNISSKTSTTKETYSCIWFPEKDNTLSGNIPAFTGSRETNIQGEFPVEYFSSLVPDDYLEEVAFQSNLYALQKGRENFRVTVTELKLFLGISLVMTYIKYARIRQYWSLETGLRLPIIADSMSVNRFEEIRRYLHFTDSSKIPNGNTDKAIRLKPFLDKLHETFSTAVRPEEFHSVDEMVIPFKGRSSIKNYLPKKPTKWGFKMWVRAGVSGYVYCFELFQGASGGRPAPSADCGALGDVVLRLCHDIEGMNCKVYADNLFSGIPLLLKLKEKAIWFVGTCRANRLKGAEKKLKTQKNLKESGRGSYSVTTSNDNVTVTRWLDNSLVHTVSTYCGLHPVGQAKRFCRKEKKIIEVPRPHSIEVYNKHMGGVDLMDSLVALYRNNFRNKRWYMRIFYHMLNVAVANSWLIWRWQSEEKMDLLEFKSRVAVGLIHKAVSELSVRKRGRPSNESIPVLKKRPTHTVSKEQRFTTPGHYPQKSKQANASRCRDTRCKRKTRYQCDTCNIPLCPECFRNFHTK